MNDKIIDCTYKELGEGVVLDKYIKNGKLIYLVEFEEGLEEEREPCEIDYV